MSKKQIILVLLLPLIAYGSIFFQGMLEAPTQYGFYIICPKNADVTVLPGADRSPEDGYFILRNTTTKEELPTIYLGELPLGNVAPGQEISYNDAFHIKNMESHNIHLTGCNFSQTIGTEFLAFYIKNDTCGDGNPEGDWIPMWLGNQTFLPANGNQLSSTNFILLTSGGELPVKIIINIPEQTSEIDEPITIFYGSGKFYLWFNHAS